MADNKDMAADISPEENPQSLDEMLDQIIDDEIENGTESDTDELHAEEAVDAAPSDAAISALLGPDAELSPEEQAAQQKKRQIMWTIFGIAIILAIILPAGYVFLKARNIASNTTQQQQTTIIPVKNDGTQASVEPTSSEATKTAIVTDEDESEPENREVDLEEWNYYLNGFNIFAPAKGARVLGADGINPTYKATVYDALDIYINKANGIQITVPEFAGDKSDDEGAESTTDGAVDTGTSTTSGDDSIVTSDNPKPASVVRIYLDAIGSNSTNKVAVWAVGNSSYQTTVGEKIGKTGWKVTKITSTTATITNGSKTYTLRVGGSAKK